jgi:hypothetical protein
VEPAVIEDFQLKRFILKALTSSKISWTLIAVASVCFESTCWAQSDQSSFHRFEGEHIVLTTDVRPTAEVAQLAEAFDAGVRVWTDLFHADPTIVKDWKADAYLMTDRTRFENAELIDRSIREFRDGHQVGDLILCKDQPSEYYRRHLLLHEGVHWFMEKALGGYGPGWWMEGIAEWQATHRWIDGKLTCGVMPASREELPYWGRLQWVREDLASAQAPSLAVLFRKAKDLHRIDSTYGWSWTAAMFFANHPRYKQQFIQRLGEPTDFSDALNADVLAWIGDDMQTVQAEFNGFVTELDYGVDPASIIIDLKSAIETKSADANSIQVVPDVGWQFHPQVLDATKRYKVESSGRVTISKQTPDLWSEPQGITLRYVAGKPLGQLITTMIPKQGSLENTIAWNRFSVSKGTSITPNADSHLLFRINCANEAMKDASGRYEVTVSEMEKPK